MNKTFVMTAAAVAALGGVWAGSTVYMGQRVQAALEAQLAPWQAPAEQGQRVIRVTGVQYDKGLLGATRTVNLAVGCGAQSATLSWRDTIRHGPLPGFAGAGAARIDSQLLLTDAQKAEWKALTGQEQPQLTLSTWVGLGGGSTTQIDMPALQLKTAEGGLLTMEKASATVTLDGKGGAKYRAAVPAYAFSGPVGAGQAGLLRVSAHDLQLESEGLAPLWWAFSGKGQGRVGRMEVALEPPGQPAKPMVALQDLRYTQDGAVQDGLYGARVQMQGKGQVGGQALDAVSMKFRMERLHGESYARFVQGIYAGTCPVEGADPQAEAQKMMAGMAALLPHSPAFHLDELQISLGGQTAKLAYSAAVQGVTDADLKAPNPALVLMKKALLNAELDVALPLISNLANAMDKPLPPDALEQGVARAAEQGWLLREGERVRAKFEFKNGAALLNGKPMPMPGQRPQPQAQ